MSSTKKTNPAAASSSAGKAASATKKTSPAAASSSAGKAASATKKTNPAAASSSAGKAASATKSTKTTNPAAQSSNAGKSKASKTVASKVSTTVGQMPTMTTNIVVNFVQNSEQGFNLGIPNSGFQLGFQQQSSMGLPQTRPQKKMSRTPRQQGVFQPQNAGSGSRSNSQPCVPLMSIPSVGNPNMFAGVNRRPAAFQRVNSGQSKSQVHSQTVEHVNNASRTSTAHSASSERTQNSVAPQRSALSARGANWRPARGGRGYRGGATSARGYREGATRARGYRGGMHPQDGGHCDSTAPHQVPVFSEQTGMSGQNAFRGQQSFGRNMFPFHSNPRYCNRRNWRAGRGQRIVGGQQHRFVAAATGNYADAGNNLKSEELYDTDNASVTEHLSVTDESEWIDQSSVFSLDQTSIIESPSEHIWSLAPRARSVTVRGRSRGGFPSRKMHHFQRRYQPGRFVSHAELQDHSEVSNWVQNVIRSQGEVLTDDDSTSVTEQSSTADDSEWVDDDSDDLISDAESLPQQSIIHASKSHPATKKGSGKKSFQSQKVPHNMKEFLGSCEQSKELSFEVNAADGMSSSVASEKIESAESESKMIDENVILAFIINTKGVGAYCRLHQLYDTIGLKTPLEAVNYLKSYRRIKILMKKSILNQSIVFIYIKGMRLCANMKRCKNGASCPFLHLCPEFVGGMCFMPSCPYSHDFHDEHNQVVIKKCGIDDICKDDKILLELVRCCTLMVCQAHNGAKSARCTDREICLKLHVCDKFLGEKCLIPNSDCVHGHDLYSERNLELLNLLELSYLRTKDESWLKRMVLRVKSSETQEEELLQKSKAKTCSDKSFTSEQVKEVPGSFSQAQKGIPPVKQSSPLNQKSEKKMQNSPAREKKGPSEDDASSGLSSGSVTETTESAESDAKMIDENFILSFIMNTKGCGAYCKVHQLYDTIGLKKPLDTVNYLKPYRRVKVLMKKSNISQSIVFVYIKGMRLCANLKRCNKVSSCPFLHLCPEFVGGTCTKTNCLYSHDFHDEHNQVIIKKCGIDDICKDDKILLELVRCCTLMVCQAHNGVENSRCTDREICLRLHVCDKFLNGKCLIPNLNCEFGHDLYSERNLELIALLELSHLRVKDERLLNRMIIRARSSVMPEQGPVQKMKDNTISEKGFTMEKGGQGKKDLPGNSEQVQNDSVPVKQQQDTPLHEMPQNSDKKKKGGSANLNSPARELKKESKVSSEVDDASSGFSSAKVTETTESAESEAEMIDENLILAFIINTKGCGAYCKVHQLYDTIGLKKPLDAVNYLKPYRRVKVLMKKSNISQSIVFVYIKGMRLCANLKRCNKVSSCPFLHLCPEFVGGTCTKTNCLYSHDFHDEHNQVIIKKCGIDDICKDDKILLELVRCCTLMVCQAHNGVENSRCTDREICLRLHVCDKFLNGKCLIPNLICEFGHDLYRERNMELIALLELSHLRVKDERLLIRMIIRARNSDMPELVRTMKGNSFSGENPPSGSRKATPVHKRYEGPSEATGVLAPGVTAAPAGENVWQGSSYAASGRVAGGGEAERIVGSESPASQTTRTEYCGEFESHRCSGIVSECVVRHFRESFCWRLQMGGEWVPFPQQADIENAFCAPECNGYSFFTPFTPTKITINFETMMCELGVVQRISTPSYVHCRDKTDATHWRWYWKQEEARTIKWVLYESDMPPYQDVLESKYLSDRTQACCFETAHSEQYMTDFIKMKQTNLRTGFKRDVRRRPVDSLNERAVHRYTFHFDPSKLPFNEEWTPMNTDLDSFSDLIPITKDQGKRKHLYSRLEAEFFRTLSRADFEIKHVYYIQNLHLWKNYQEKKNRMRVAHEQFERQLFHGTVDETTVRCICHQNFDHRMHGVHGTMYGKGAYFATTAKYSHNYTRPFGSAGSRWMFFARVLIGKSALGHLDDRRPPPLDPRLPHGALYDTCVDNVDNPSIYVVFNDVQCYPEFLIEYKELQPLSAAASQPTGLHSLPSHSYPASPSGFQSLPSHSASPVYQHGSASASPHATSQAQAPNQNSCSVM